MKTYIVTLDYYTASVHFDELDGELSDEQIEEFLSLSHDLNDIYYMVSDSPIDVFRGNRYINN